MRPSCDAGPWRTSTTRAPTHTHAHARATWDEKARALRFAATRGTAERPRKRPRTNISEEKNKLRCVRGIATGKRSGAGTGVLTTVGCHERARGDLSNEHAAERARAGVREPHRRRRAAQCAGRDRGGRRGRADDAGSQPCKPESGDPGQVRASADDAAPRARQPARGDAGQVRASERAVGGSSARRPPRARQPARAARRPLPSARGGLWPAARVVHARASEHAWREPRGAARNAAVYRLQIPRWAVEGAVDPLRLRSPR